MVFACLAILACMAPVNPLVPPAGWPEKVTCSVVTVTCAEVPERALSSMRAACAASPSCFEREPRVFRFQLLSPMPAILTI